jgi:hypothetical protein
MVIIAIFVGFAAALAGLVGFTNLEQEEIGPLVDVALADVRMKGIDKENPTLMIVRVDFTIFNETKQTLTIAKIDYDMYANEQFIGRGILSLEDAPLTGRAPLFPGTPTTLPSEMQLRQSPEVMHVWDELKDGNTDDIKWRADGVAQIETAFSIIEKEFDSTL